MSTCNCEKQDRWANCCKVKELAGKLLKTMKVVDAVERATWDEMPTGGIIVGAYSWERIQHAIEEVKK